VSSSGRTATWRHLNCRLESYGGRRIQSMSRARRTAIVEAPLSRLCSHSIRPGRESRMADRGRPTARARPRSAVIVSDDARLSTSVVAVSAGGSPWRLRRGAQGSARRLFGRVVPRVGLMGPDLRPELVVRCVVPVAASVGVLSGGPGPLGVWRVCSADLRGYMCTSRYRPLQVIVIGLSLARIRAARD
jgi:hypothetical protein